MLKKLKSKKGFTLIELIVVIAVIAILAAILLPQFTGFSDNAKRKAALSDARNISVAVSALIAENGTATVITTGDIETYLGRDYTGVAPAGVLTMTGAAGVTNGDFTYAKANYTVTYDQSAGTLVVTP